MQEQEFEAIVLLGLLGIFCDKKSTLVFLAYVSYLYFFETLYYRCQILACYNLLMCNWKYLIYTLLGIGWAEIDKKVLAENIQKWLRNVFCTLVSK